MACFVCGTMGMMCGVLLGPLVFLGLPLLILGMGPPPPPPPPKPPTPKP